MPEILLHYIWQKRLWAGFPQTTTDGKPIEIISVGQHNIHAGADFCHAHIRIGEQEWIGNVEMHVQASDWYKHNHHTNPAYDTTILHVVCHADKQAVNSKGDDIPQCELQYPHNKDYLSLIFQQPTLEYIPCGKQLLEKPSILTKGWKNILLEQRLECKQQSIKQLLNITQGSWVHAFYITLAHNFGFHTNGLPFEMLAIQTPLSCLLKHRNSLFQLTAILLGQAGLLNANAHNQELGMWEEYCFLQKKFSLQPMDHNLWKKARMYPNGAPEVRIRQFAHLIYQSEHLFADLMEASTIEDMIDMLSLQDMNDEAYARTKRPLPIGRKSIEILLINTVIPYRYAYKQNADTYETIKWLEQIKKEDNTITRQWAMLGQKMHSAADSQALIHLYQNYCQPHQCFHCQIGHQIFALKELIP